MKNIIEKREFNNNGRLTFEKLESQLDHLVKGQEVNRQEFQLGFIGLATQNQELLDLNNHLSEQLKKVVEELDILKKEKEIRKQAREKRKRLPKRDPITSYLLLLSCLTFPHLVVSIIGLSFCSLVS